MPARNPISSAGIGLTNPEAGVTTPSSGKLSEPAIFVVSTLRALNASVTDHPFMRTITLSPGTVFNQWDLKGAYFTFRVGPSVSYLITDRLKLNLSAGAAMVYSGTNYTVTQTYQPAIGDPIVSTAQDDESKLLVGYYLDASLQFDITERAGFYAGAVYQDTGSYTQTADLNDSFTGSHASYKSLIDLSSLSGFRMGMTFRF